MTARRTPAYPRFLAKIDKTPACWLWRGGLSTVGLLFTAS